MSDTLSEFILARVDETEAIARAITLDPDGVARQRFGKEGRVQWMALALDRPWRKGLDAVLARCAADRAIMEAHRPIQSTSRSEWYGEDEMPESGLACTSCGTFGEYSTAYPCATLRHLGSVWADHPDYREEWKP